MRGGEKTTPCLTKFSDAQSILTNITGRSESRTKASNRGQAEKSALFRCQTEITEPLIIRSQWKVNEEQQSIRYTVYKNQMRRKNTRKSSRDDRSLTYRQGLFAPMWAEAQTLCTFHALQHQREPDKLPHCPVLHGTHRNHAPRPTSATLTQ